MPLHLFISFCLVSFRSFLRIIQMKIVPTDESQKTLGVSSTYCACNSFLCSQQCDSDHFWGGHSRVLLSGCWKADSSKELFFSWQWLFPLDVQLFLFSSSQVWSKRFPPWFLAIPSQYSPIACHDHHLWTCELISSKIVRKVKM